MTESLMRTPKIQQRDNGWFIEFFTPIVETTRDPETGDVTVKGIAINAGTTRNQHTFLPEELEKAAKTLTGRPLLKDHDNSVDSIIGQVFGSVYDQELKAVFYKATVDGENPIARMIEKGFVNSVSIGAFVEEFDDRYDDDSGDFIEVILRGIEFIELSAVAVPADPGATIGKEGLAGPNSFQAMVTCALQKKWATEGRDDTGHLISHSTANIADDKIMAEDKKTEELVIQTVNDALKETLGPISESLSNITATLDEQSKRFEALEAEDEPTAPAAPAPEPAPAEPAPAEEPAPATEAAGVVQGVDEDGADPVSENNDDFIVAESKGGGRVDITLAQPFGRYKPSPSALAEAMKVGRAR